MINARGNTVHPGISSHACEAETLSVRPVKWPCPWSVQALERALKRLQTLFDAGEKIPSSDLLKKGDYFAGAASKPPASATFPRTPSPPFHIKKSFTDPFLVAARGHCVLSRTTKRKMESEVTPNEYRRHSPCTPSSWSVPRIPTLELPVPSAPKPIQRQTQCPQFPLITKISVPFERI